MREFFEDLPKIWAENRKRGDAARLMNDPGVTPEPGHVYTVSPDFGHGDKSWVDCFWEVIGRSGPNVMVRIHTRPENVERFWRIDDRYWYPADDLFAQFGAAPTPAT